MTGSGTLYGYFYTYTSNIDVSTLQDGTLTYAITLTDQAGNVGPSVTTSQSWIVQRYRLHNRGRSKFH